MSRYRIKGKTLIENKTELLTQLATPSFCAFIKAETPFLAKKKLFNNIELYVFKDCPFDIENSIIHDIAISSVEECVKPTT